MPVVCHSFVSRLIQRWPCPIVSNDLSLSNESHGMVRYNPNHSPNHLITGRCGCVCGNVMYFKYKQLKNRSHYPVALLCLNLERLNLEPKQCVNSYCYCNYHRVWRQLRQCGNVIHTFVRLPVTSVFLQQLIHVNKKNFSKLQICGARVIGIHQYPVDSPHKRNVKVTMKDHDKTRANKWIFVIEMVKKIWASVTEFNEETAVTLNHVTEPVMTQNAFTCHDVIV